MTKTTAASVEKTLRSSLEGFKARAAAAKEEHKTLRKAITDDLMQSDLAKDGDYKALNDATRAKLASIRSEQDTFIKGLHDKVEGELRGAQPTDANSVLLRRDASDRVRKITDKQEAMEVLQDALANGDTTLAHAVGTRARNTGMGTVADAYRDAFPDTANSAAALATIENLTNDGAYNLANQITYSAPNL